VWGLKEMMALIPISKLKGVYAREIQCLQSYLTSPADMLALIIKRAKADGQKSGVIPHLVDDDLSILQYDDDTIIFLDHDLE
jgi:hypothetical protein